MSRGRVRWGRVGALLLVLGLLLGGCTAVVTDLLGTPEQSTEPVSVVVEKGMGASGVADLLAEEGVIRNASVFKLQARMDERSSRIRPGTYEFAPGTSFDDIMAALTEVPSEAPTF